MDKNSFNVIPFRMKPEDKNKRLDSTVYNIMNTLNFTMLNKDNVHSEVTIELLRTESNSFYDVILEKQSEDVYRMYPDGLLDLIGSVDITTKTLTVSNINKKENITKLAEEIYLFLKDPNLVYD